MDASVRSLAWLVPLVLLGCTSAAPLPPKAIALNRDGAIALAEGDLVTAEARLAVAVEYNPRFVEAWVNLGLVELRRGNFVLARAHLTRARSLNPDLPAPHHGLGLLAEREGHPREAEDHYRDALAVDPGFGAARANLGRKLFERGALEDAREQFLRLTEVCPEMVDGSVGLVETLVRLARFDDADAALARAKTRHATHPAVVLLDAERLLRLELWPYAIDELELLTHDPDRERAATAWGWLSVARLGAGDTRGAQSAAQAALTLDDAQPVARYALQKLGLGRARP
jgi:tetratricopeptide (TPR) repeat protein